MTLREMRHAEAVTRAYTRAQLALMSDTDLAHYLGWAHAREMRPAYRAAWHEAVVVRGARGIPRI